MNMVPESSLIIIWFVTRNMLAWTLLGGENRSLAHRLFMGQSVYYRIVILRGIPDKGSWGPAEGMVIGGLLLILAQHLGHITRGGSLAVGSDYWGCLWSSLLGVVALATRRSQGKWEKNNNTISTSTLFRLNLSAMASRAATCDLQYHNRLTTNNIRSNHIHSQYKPKVGTKSLAISLKISTSTALKPAYQK